MRFLVWLLYFSWSFISSFGWIYWDGRKGHGVFIQRWLIIRIKYWKHPYGQWGGFSAGVLFEGYPIQWNCRKWGTFVSFGRIRRPKHRFYWDQWCHWARNLNHHPTEQTQLHPGSHMCMATLVHTLLHMHLFGNLQFFESDFQARFQVNNPNFQRFILRLSSGIKKLKGKKIIFGIMYFPQFSSPLSKGKWKNFFNTLSYLFLHKFFLYPFVI